MHQGCKPPGAHKRLLAWWNHFTGAALDTPGCFYLLLPAGKTKSFLDKQAFYLFKQLHKNKKQYNVSSQQWWNNEAISYAKISTMKMDATIKVVVPTKVKEKFWKLSKERGLLPSQLLREAIVQMIDRFEWDAKYKEGGRSL